MENLKEIKLDSGAVLKIAHPPFADAKELLQAVLEEMKDIKIASKTEVDFNLFKDIFCTGFSSKRIEKALANCMRRCTYNSLKIDESTFEPVEARQDYLIVIFEVAQEVLQPFTKTLIAKFSNIMQGIGSIHE